MNHHVASYKLVVSLCLFVLLLDYTHGHDPDSLYASDQG